MHLGFVPNEAEQQQQVPVDAMGDESQVPSKATGHSSTAQICHVLSRAWCCLLVGAVAL